MLWWRAEQTCEGQRLCRGMRGATRLPCAAAQSPRVFLLGVARGTADVSAHVGHSMQGRRGKKMFLFKVLHSQIPYPGVVIRGSSEAKVRRSFPHPSTTPAGSHPSP